MTQRNLNALKTKSKEIQIEDLTIQVHGLTFPELSEFLQIGERDKHAASNYLLRVSLRKAIPATELSDVEFEQLVKELSSQASLKIVQTTVELSGLNDDAKKLVSPVNQ